MTAPATTAVERTAAISTLLLAFSSDPIIRWLWPDGDDYLDAFHEFVGLGSSTSSGTAGGLSARLTSPCRCGVIRVSMPHRGSRQPPSDARRADAVGRLLATEPEI